jgi:hypothetical protein
MYVDPAPENQNAVRFDFPFLVRPGVMGPDLVFDLIVCSCRRFVVVVT